MFPQLLTNRNVELFGAIWGALEAHLAPYHTLYTGAETTQARLEDSDRLPFSLDFLVVEEVDYLHTLLGTTAIKYEVQKQLTPAEGSGNTALISQIIAIAVGYAHIPTEDEEMWELDVNCFLSEETSETANYTLRTACSCLVQRLGDAKWPVADSVLQLTKAIFENPASR